MSKKDEKKVGMTEEEITASKNAELTKRSTAFNEELIPLLGKYKLGLGAVAFLWPDGRVGARPQLFDDVAPKKEVATDTKENDTDLPSA